MEINYLKSIDEQIELIKRGTVQICEEDELRDKLAAGKPLNVKLGVDPTAGELHLGFTVVLRKLQQFQDLGHKAILIIGSYTAQVGDPSGRDKTRPQLSEEQVIENARFYLEQAGTILDLEKLEVLLCFLHSCNSGHRASIPAAHNIQIIMKVRL